MNDKIFRKLRNFCFRAFLAGVAASLSFGVAGCHGKHEHEHEGEESHQGHSHNETLQLTAYNSEFELFAEAQPFVAGQESEILVHFTKLSDFKPLEKGKVSMKLTIGGKSVSVVCDKPVHPGIYEFKVRPEKRGEGNLSFEIEGAGGKSVVTVPGITVYDDEHEAHHEAAEAAAKSSNGIVFPKEQSWNVEFSTEKVASEPFGEVIRTMARVEPSQGDERVLVAKSAGTVRFAAADLTAGKAVGSGQALFTIDSEGLADNNMSVRYQEAKRAYETAKSEYERKEELAREKLVTESDFRKAKNEYETAAANYGNLKRNFASGRHSEGSPMSGFIKKVYVRNGEYVEAGSPVMEVAQNRRLYITAELQPSKYHALRDIVSTNFKTASGSEVYSVADLNGSLVSYGRSVDEENPLVPVVFQIDNTVDLLPGSFVEMYITAGRGERSLTVPNSSLVEEMGNYFVFVQLTPEFFEKREVEPGKSNGLRTEILSGLKENERIVGKGAVLVKLAQASGKLDAHAGHVH